MPKKNWKIDRESRDLTVMSSVDLKTPYQKKYWTLGASDVVRALTEWADEQDKKAEKAARKRGGR